MRQPQRKELRALIKPHLSSRSLADTLPYPTHVSHPTARPSSATVSPEKESP